MCAEDSLVFSGYSCDVWASGVVLYIMATGRLPFFSDVPLRLFDLIAEADLKLGSLNASAELKSLLQLVLNKDPENRGGIGDCLSHPFCQRARDQRLAELGEGVSRHPRITSKAREVQQAFASTDRDGSSVRNLAVNVGSIMSNFRKRFGSHRTSVFDMDTGVPTEVQPPRKKLATALVRNDMLDDKGATRPDDKRRTLSKKLSSFFRKANKKPRHLTRSRGHVDLEVLVDQNHIVKRLPRRHHWKAGGPLDPNVEQNRLVVIFEEELSHHLGKLLLALAVQTLDPEGAGESGVLGALIPDGDIPLVMEQALPVLDHHLALIVEDHELDGYLLLPYGLELGERHIERAVAVDRDAHLRRVGELRPHAVAETDSHGPEGPGREHLPRPRPRYKLRGRHLVYPHARAEDRVVDRARLAELPVHLGYDALGAHLRPGDGLLVPVFVLDLVCLWLVPVDLDGVLPLKLVLPLDPLLRPPQLGRAGPDGAIDRRQELLPRRVDEVVRSDLLGVLREPDVDVYYAPPSLLGRLPRRGDEVRRPPRDPVVEPRPDADEQVAVLDEVVGRRVSVHAQHVRREGVPLVEGPEGVERRGHGHLERLGELHELLGGVVAPLAGDDERPSGVLDGLDHLVHDPALGHVAELAHLPLAVLLVYPLVVHAAVDGVGAVVVEVVGVVSGLDVRQLPLGVDLEAEALLDAAEVYRRGVRDEAHELPVVVEVVLDVPRVGAQSVEEAVDELRRELLYLQVLGQVDEDGARPAVARDVEGVVHGEGHLGRGSDLVGPLGDGAHDVDGGAALEGVLRRRGGGLAAEHDHGHAVAHGVGDGRDEVGGAGPRGGHDDARGELPVRLGGALGDALRDVAGRRLVGVGDPPDALVLAVPRVRGVELVQQGQDGPAGVAVHHLHAVLQQLRVDDVRGRVALEVGHVRPRGGLRRQLGRPVHGVPRPRRRQRGAEARRRPDGLARGGRVGHGGHAQGLLSARRVLRRDLRPSPVGPAGRRGREGRRAGQGGREDGGRRGEFHRQCAANCGTCGRLWGLFVRATVRGGVSCVVFSPRLLGVPGWRDGLEFQKRRRGDPMRDNSWIPANPGLLLPLAPLRLHSIDQPARLFRGAPTAPTSHPATLLPAARDSRVQLKSMARAPAESTVNDGPELKVVPSLLATSERRLLVGRAPRPQFKRGAPSQLKSSQVEVDNRSFDKQVLHGVNLSKLSPKFAPRFPV
ncbi:hypothetical protein THAOC_32080 [Thalassiosira oceanica]|uniref:non-specific serine/threonine protein kinase n=1 Tax=Thalassiosira oceanica TaxID=159749 RepID=K0RA11_THAOC|nr:hypothetical protein THAOC_32080 [Thalassiosira oceanica]|eukprot:EJK49079.1 hypothetical protein THAOC_32080 [Thalassiosira oceanica]